MPLYEYRCGACGEVFEVIQKFSDQPLTVHEGCGGAVQRLLSAPALQFKGSGWYVTDYARKGNGKEGKEEKDSKAKSDGGDGKPAAEAGKSDSAKSESKKSDSARSEGSKSESKPASTTTTSEKK